MKTTGKKRGFLIVEGVVAAAAATAFLTCALATVRMSMLMNEKADNAIARERLRTEMIANISSGSGTSSYTKNTLSSYGGVNYYSYTTTDAEGKTVKVFWIK